LNHMFTTCPSCALNLAVTPMDLRVGQGYVRCGRCERVFNALLSLTEDLDVDRQSGLAATGTTTVPALPDPEASLPPAEPEPNYAPQDETPSQATPQKLPDPDLDNVHLEATGTFETIVLEGDSYLQTEELVDEEEFDLQVQEISEQIQADDFEHVRAELGVEEHGENVYIDYSSEPLPQPVDEVDAEDALGNSRKLPFIWTIAASVLAVLLAAQFVHYFRQSLVVQPWAEGTLKAVYSIFGVTLEPQWEIAAYDVRQLGGSAVPGDDTKILLRATVHNTARHAQPPPLLRVTLQDRFGNSLATRDIAPQDYLKGEGLSRLKADQRVDAELKLDDPNKQAVGFELDACLPGADKRLHCGSSP
jgi:predicted Zn finger-like uncharacterized protein